MPAPLTSAPLIIGGGPAGAAAAIVLAAAGKRPVLLERSPVPADKVCGDFLTGEAVTMLRALGLDVPRLGAVPVRGVRLVHGSRIAEAALPFPAAGLSRRALDDALLSHAAARGAAITRGCTVRSLSIHETGAAAELRPGGRLLTQAVFLATGKHDLRGWPRQPRTPTGSIGLKTYIKLCPAQASELADAVELVLFAGGYAGLQHVENHRTVLCALVSPECVRETGASDLAGVMAGLSPHLCHRLEGAQPLLPRALAVAGLPYGHLRAEAPEKLVYRLGDQAAVIPSLTGDGVAIALASGILAAESWLRGESAEEFQTRFASLLRPQMRRASLVHAASRSTRLQPALALACSGFPRLLRHVARITRVASTMTGMEGRLSRVASPERVPQKREAEGDHAAPCATAG